MKTVVLFLTFCLVLGGNSIAFITGVTVESVSSNFADVPLGNPQLLGGFNRYAQYTVDDSINYLGVPGAHRNLPDGDHGSMWLTDFRLGRSTTTDYVVYNLNGVYDLVSMDVWNYNENPGAGYTKWGVKTMDVSVSADNVNWIPIGNVTLNAAPGLEGVDFHENKALAASGVRYVKFNNFVSLDNTNFAIGLSHVQFNVASLNVDAGANQYAWLENCIATVELSGTVNGQSGPVTTLWSLFSGEPNNITFDDPNALATTATITATGNYTLKLEADDGTLSGEDFVLIKIYPDACVTAQNEVSGFAFDDGDINHDCLVNLDDFMIVAGNWLGCTSLDCP